MPEKNQTINPSVHLNRIGELLQHYGLGTASTVDIIVVNKQIQARFHHPDLKCYPLIARLSEYDITKGLRNEKWIKIQSIIIDFMKRGIL